MNIQVLYLEGCPNHPPTVALVRHVVADLGIETEVEELEVKDQEEAEHLRFLGSPTVLVNGVDIDPSARERTDYGMSCRIYDRLGVPSRELLVAACAVSHGRCVSG
ncbi:MAG: DUF2703 domain-containing protein [Deltaproteobacteria bacterium]|nr:DUF2703 domain-containing protein [Deltaproteobacteria bacterium]